MNQPTTLVLFGVTGDLSRRKIVPALFSLQNDEKVAESLEIIGIARRDWTNNDFRDFLKESLAEHSPNVMSEDNFAARLRHFSFQAGELTVAKDFVALKDRLDLVARDRRVIYHLAVPPTFYGQILNHMKEAELNLPDWPIDQRPSIIVEKPFGSDEATSARLCEQLDDIFLEEDVYRMDHYLGRALVRVMLPFCNEEACALLWNRRTIESIDLALQETIGVERRAEMYDAVGALRDVGQNHLLEMLAMVTMGHPKVDSPQAVQAARTEILEALKPLSAEEIAAKTMRGQYSGYRALDGVKPGSTTETAFELSTELDLPNWRGVKIALSAGKKLPEVKKSITINFNTGGKLILPLDNTPKLVIEGEIPLTLRATIDAHQAKLDVDPHRDAYETLLLDCLNKDQTFFVSCEEVAAAWRFVDSIRAEWANGTPELREY